jgi:hypothetical protein
MCSPVGVGGSRGVETGLATMLPTYVNVSRDRRKKDLEDKNKERNFNIHYAGDDI